MDTYDPAAVEELLALLDADYPDPVDDFENRLAAALGVVPHPDMDLDTWRRRRVAIIEAAGDRADALGEQIADELLGETRAS